MALPEQKFAGITTARFNIICAEVKKQIGVEIATSSGQRSGKGLMGKYTVAWCFDPAAQTLTIQCLSKPFLVPAETVQADIAQLVKSC